MAQVVDDARVGTKGHPRHWRELGRDPPLREAEDAGARAMSVPPTRLRRWR